MTNLYNSSQKLPKIVIIHGMNNNLKCFDPLKEELEKRGFNCELVPLPGHDKKHKKCKDFSTAFEIFDAEMKKVTNAPYLVVAFSQGALYTQLWMDKNEDKRPLAQVLLAPALYVKYQHWLNSIAGLLPANLMLISRTPKPLRLKFMLPIQDYRILMEGIFIFHKLKEPFPIPTKLIIDEMDELLDAKVMSTISNINLDFEFLNRPKLKKGFGSHHVLFHPDYFTKSEWEDLIFKIENFFKHMS